MTRLRATNAETGIYSAEGWSRSGVGAEVVRDNTITPHAGSWSWCVGGDGVGKNSWQAPTIVTDKWYIVRGYIRIGATPATEQSTFFQAGAASTPILPLRLLPSGALGSVAATAFNQMAVTNSPLLTPGAWHKLEAAYRVSGGDNFQHNGFFRLDGVEFGRFATRNSGTFNRLMFTTAAAAFPVRINLDDLVLNDSDGSSDNYWPDNVRPLSRSALGYVPPSVRSTSAISVNVPSLTLTVSAPSVIVAGDLLLAAIYTSSATTITPPSGWSAIGVPFSGGGSGVLYLFVKTATASEPSSYSFASSGNPTSTTVAWSLSGVKLANPVLDLSLSSLQGSTAFIVAPPLDLSEGDTLSLELCFFNNATATISTVFPSVSSGMVNAKSGSVGVVGGFFPRADGGLAGGDAAIGSVNVNQGVVTQIAFRAADPVRNKLLAVV